MSHTSLIKDTRHYFWIKQIFISFFIFHLFVLIYLVCLIHDHSMLIINLLLFEFNIFEHVVLCIELIIIRKYLWIFFIKLKCLLESLFRLPYLVGSFEVIARIIKEKIIAEYWDYIGLLVKDNFVDYFNVVVFFVS